MDFRTGISRRRENIEFKTGISRIENIEFKTEISRVI